MCCQDPSHGEVTGGCPDVAVLHLTGGPELPAELTLAAPDELSDLFASPSRCWASLSATNRAGPRPGRSLRRRFARDRQPAHRLEGVCARESWEPQSLFSTAFPPGLVPAAHRSSFPTVTSGDQRRNKRSRQRGLTNEQPSGPPHRLPLGIARVSQPDRSSAHSRQRRPALNLARYQEVAPYEARCHAAMALVGLCNRLRLLRGDFLWPAKTAIKLCCWHPVTPRPCG